MLPIILYSTSFHALCCRCVNLEGFFLYTQSDINGLLNVLEYYHQYNVLSLHSNILVLSLTRVVYDQIVHGVLRVFKHAECLNAKIKYSLIKYIFFVNLKQTNRNPIVLYNK